MGFNEPAVPLRQFGLRFVSRQPATQISFDVFSSPEDFVLCHPEQYFIG
jgi:hypothetical protein